MLSSKTDTYALGVTFAQVVVMTVPLADGGAPLRPWIHYTSVDQHPEMLADARARLVSQPETLGAGLASVLEGCCKTEARERMDAAEVVARLEALAPGAVSSLPPLRTVEDLDSFFTALQDPSLPIASLNVGLSLARSFANKQNSDVFARIVPAMCSIMSRHKGTAVVQQLAAALLGILSQWSPACAEAAVDVGMALVQAAAVLHVAHAGVQVAACDFVAGAAYKNDLIRHY
jgi:hypothetical protein